MDTPEQADKLEQALLERAHELAREQLNHAEGERSRLLQQARERLHQRQQQQKQQLKELGERHYRQKLQAAELSMQSYLERLRWTLIEATLGELDGRLAQLCEEEERYGEVLQSWLAEAVEALNSDGELILHLNKRDRERYAKRFSNYPLSDEPLTASGGLVLYRADGKARYDNSFEGRRKRLNEDLFSLVGLRLFGSEVNLGSRRGR